MKQNILHSTRIDIAQKDRIELINMLNKSLASASDLQMQLKQAHWNVKGKEFIAIHKFFDELAAALEEHVDIIAERVTSLGGTALGTLQEAVNGSILKVYPINIFSAKEHLESLADNFAILAQLSRKNIKDAENLNDIATGDLYIALTRMLDKNLWFIEAHLQQ